MKNYRDILIKAGIAIAAIIIIFTSISRLLFTGSDTLSDYAQKNPQLAYKESIEGTEGTVEGEDSGEDTVGESAVVPEAGGSNATPGTAESDSTGALETDGSTGTQSSLGGSSNNPGTQGEASGTPSPEATPLPQEVIIQQFYYAPLTEEQKDYITGCSFPDTEEELAITYEDLSYVHILHYDFEGNLAEGELICNNYIAQDLLEIFYELYLNEYQLEKVTLIENYGGDDDLSMADNNTSCFNYRVVPGKKKLSQHAYGLAIDINPFYNPYITYPNGGVHVAPAGSEAYADRSKDFPYKIDENDLCYKLFKEHGFTWGGDWNSSKDYQHFQKALP